MASADVPVGTRHFCPSSWGYGCDRGDGKAPRKRCRRCGGQLVSVPVTYGVYVWRGDGRYREDDALALFARESAANRWIERHSHEYAHTAGGIVVR